MTTNCIACKKPVRPWHKKGFNSSWHKLCTDIWNAGYNIAKKYCNDENRTAGYPIPDELYWARQNPFQ